MPNLNNILNSIQKKTYEVNEAVQNLLVGYNDLYHEGTRMFNEERTASNGSMDGLGEFYRLVQIIRRNRDVVGSINRGMKNIRTMDQFKFIEEDVKIEKTKKQKKKPEINEKSIQNLKIPEEVTAEVN